MEVVRLSLILVFAVLVVQALTPQAWKNTRPFSCQLCLTWWGVVAYTLSPWWRSEGYETVLAAGGLALLLLALHGWLKGSSLVPPGP
jgi:hypothetical protein